VTPTILIALAGLVGAAGIGLAASGVEQQHVSGAVEAGAGRRLCVYA